MLLSRIQTGSLLGLLFITLLISICLSVAIGSANVSPGTVFSIVLHKLVPSLQEVEWSKGKEAIIWQIRFPRVLLAVFVGAGLAVVGTCLQAVTRNSMADPYLFGASAGASFGAVLVILHLGMFLGPFSLPLAAFTGALISMLLVLLVAYKGQGLSQQKLILSGVAVHFILMSMTNFLIFSGKQQAASSAMFWMLGGLGSAQWSQLLYPCLVLIIVFAWMYYWSSTLNAIMAGDETATTLGINVAQTRIAVFVLCALLTGVMVAFSGAIGFVGLMVPHTVRLLVGADNAKVLPVSALVGALLLLWADALARTIIAPQDLPVGIVTAVLGGGFFIHLMAKK